ncbi:hypothetical protein [Pseudoalteromonas sp. BDTF-M6]|uniref:hypothetical protein n=1 Tax=Pseudoalteromonas sp. BDTF-M6 TaxID=2796132 RepID=UPI001BAE944C|nr:hypothetical protein [Pseudoalteromonas sp. BDTF-M6]MBS3797193.1 hypothetical protein [Pseudoalteromonas sp. BDTF-M6]
MMKAISNIVTVWGFISILIVIFNWAGLLPKYDIQLVEKKAITPEVLVHPGENIRLNALFLNSVSNQKIEAITWSLQDSKGNKYQGIPNLSSVDIQLLPDFSGMMKISVEAKIFGESNPRTGEGSFQIVQTNSYQMKKLTHGEFSLPDNLTEEHLKLMQVYAGSSQWVDAAMADSRGSIANLKSQVDELTTWGGKAYIRYIPKESNSEQFEYAVATQIDADENNQ